ncbi:FecR domain-containing protein [Cupriavidus sp. NPDC089707]|uniref:FecR family protein n=1 Tax=Cupriavidus sp. NPDC089707 TaxID=3363963 RepID=UPI00382128C3
MRKWIGTAALAGVAWLAGVAGPAQAGPAGAEGADFLYLVEPGDTLIGLAERYMASTDGWRTLQRLNGVADPYRLVPGTRLRIPLSQIPEQAASARVVYVNGEVRANGRPVQVGMSLDESVRIETPAAGSVTLELPDRSRVTLPPKTTVAVRRLRTFARSGLTDTVIRIEQGGADTRVAPEGSGVGRFELHTPMMVTGVRGTSYRVAADAAGSRSEVLEGRIGVSAARQARPAPAPAGRAMTAAAQVSAGYGVGVSDRGRLSQPVALLPAPVLLPPADTVLGPAFDAAWQPVPGASAYRVTVARDAALTELAWSGTTTDTRARPEGLPEGTLYLAVSAIDANRLTGHAAQAPVAVRLNPPAPFTLQPAADAVRYGETVAFAWATVPSAASYELAVAGDAGFAGEVALQPAAEPASTQPQAPGQYWWRVRSVDAAGRPGPWSAPVAYRVEPPGPVASMQDDGKTLQIGWPADRGAGTGYRVQLSADAGFATLLVDQHSETSAIELPRPAPGVYYVRVARAAPGTVPDPAAFSAPQRIEIFTYLMDGNGSAIGAGGGTGGGGRIRLH